MLKQEYSVLMSVYYKENPKYLEESMESIYKQTIPTNDFVLVCDGPLGIELSIVIEKMKVKFGKVLNVIYLEKNCGLGNALNEGLKYCKNEFIARMDSDDISYVDRCEKELKVLVQNPEIDIVSGTVEEFSEITQNIEAKRILPEKHQEILKFARKRNPFNHPCVMYRKSAVEAAGNYQDFYLLEDYYLWIRMLLNGNKGYNLQESILYMRAGDSMYKRRGGWKYAKSQIRFLNYLKKQKFITFWIYICSILVRVIGAMIPIKTRKILYKMVLRKKLGNKEKNFLIYKTLK